MKREIKFRAWDEYSMIDHEMLREAWTYNHLVADIDDNIQIMQYTGLKDKNGVEIYEGDIVTHDDRKTVIAWTNKLEEKYTMEGYGCYFRCGFNHYLIFGKTNEIEVIGNIYENPELL